MEEKSHVDDLSEIQYTDLYKEDDVPLSDVRKSSLSKFIYFGAILLLIFIILGSTLKFPNQINVPFVLHHENLEQIYRFAYPVYISERYVNSNQKVQIGDKLVTINSPEITELIQKYNNAYSSLDLFKNNESLVLEKQIEILGLDIKSQEILLTKFEDEKNMLEGFWENDSSSLAVEYEEKSNVYDVKIDLHKDGIISDFDQASAKTEKMKAYNQLNRAHDQYNQKKLKLRNDIIEGQLKIEQLNQQINKLHLEKTKKREELNNNINLIHNMIASQFGNFSIDSGRLTLRADSGCDVTYVIEGQREVAEGVILMKLNNEPNDLYALSSVSPQYIGKVKLKSAIVLKVETFPHYEWGTLDGTIEYLSKAPDETGNYPFHVTLGKSDKMSVLLQAGMNGSCSITLEEKSLFGYIFREINKSIYDTIE